MAFAMKRKRAFTLVEMLIVIVVVGILAGIYLLSAAPAIERAKETDCIADRATMKREYYLLKAGNTYATSADLMEDFANAVKNDLGRSNVIYNGGIFYNICRDGGSYDCTIDDNGAITINCYYHNKQASVTSSVDLTTVAKKFANISLLSLLNNGEYKYSTSIGDVSMVSENVTLNVL